MTTTNSHSPTVGLFAIGLETYWDQFEGLRERLDGYRARVRDGLEERGAEVVDAGLVDTVDKAVEAGRRFKREDVSLVFLYVSTYALSETVLPVVQKAEAPVVVLNLQPTAAVDYEAINQMQDRIDKTGEWLANCQACAVPEIASVFNRARIDFHQVTGTLQDEEAWDDIRDWIEAARVARVMTQNRLGIMGHYYSGMLDIYSDPTQHATFFGSHIEYLEVDDLLVRREKVTDTETERKIEEIYEEFDVSEECPDDEIERAAQTACALDDLVGDEGLGSLAYYYEGAEGSANEELMGSVIVGTSLLTGRHVPVSGECDVKNAQAMKIMDAFGAGGSFTEFYSMDFEDGVVLMGHDGPGHIKIADGKPKLKPLRLYHGKPSHGLSIEMSVANGPVTILSVVQTHDGRLKLLVAEGEAVPGPILEIGNTNSRYRFPIGVKDYVETWNSHGPAHHCAVGVGHIASRIHNLGSLLGMEVSQVC
jgi:L-arabinose isomerase